MNESDDSLGRETYKGRIGRKLHCWVFGEGNPELRR